LLAARGGKINISENETIKKAIQSAEKALEGTGRVLVRASGTEPLVRVMMEGQDEAVIQKLAEELTAVIQKEMK